MCGLVGWIGENFKDSTLNKIQLSLSHRGPDDFGKWVDYSKKICLLHRRLSILDISKNGRQPMVSSSKRYVLTYNGEIYNHLDIRKSIKNYKWKSSSDTETLLVGLELWGFKKTLQKIKGMFAFSVFDKELDKLFLIRDRVGEKPLYYGWQGKSFIFSSELKAITKHPSFLKNIDHKILYHFVKHSNIPAPYSIYKGIKKLNPGSFLTFCLKTKNIKVEKYWNVYDFVPGKKDLFKGTIEDAQNQLEILIQNSVKQQMISDVPLGAFLSGGIDSSTIVAILQSMSTKPVRTFSIGFENENFNEAPFAKQIATHLKTEHNELYVNPKDVLKVIPDIGEIYCEPFSDSSQIPTYILSKFTKKHVTVALTGDGGDELFGGYNRYLFANQLWSKISSTPIWTREIIKNFSQNLSPEFINLMLSPIKFFLPDNYKINLIGDRVLKGLKIISVKKNLELYKNLISHSNFTDQLLAKNENYQSVIDNNYNDKVFENDFIHKMMIYDFLDYLPNDILVKLDRAAMACSLETRVPFLDRDIIEFAWKLDLGCKIRGDKGKFLIRNILQKYIPKSLFERPKMGFGIPLASWIRGPLRDWAIDLLNEQQLSEEGFFNPKFVKKLLNEHLSGKRNWESVLWDLLVFQSWLKRS